MNAITEATLIERAARAERRFCSRWLFVYEQPCKYLSSFDQGTQMLTLRNSRGDLAAFRYNSKHDRLTRVDENAGGGAA